MVIYRLRAVAAISTWRLLLVVSICSPKKWSVKSCLFFFVSKGKAVETVGFFSRAHSFVLTGLCHLDTGSEVDMEVAIDPLLCHYQGPIGSLLQRDNMYLTDPTEVFTGLQNSLATLLLFSYKNLFKCMWRTLKISDSIKILTVFQTLQVVPLTKGQLVWTPTTAAWQTLKGGTTSWPSILTSARPLSWPSFPMLVCIMLPPTIRATIVHQWRRGIRLIMGDLMNVSPPATPSWVGLKFMFPKPFLLQNFLCSGLTSCCTFSLRNIWESSQLEASGPSSRIHPTVSNTEWHNSARESLYCSGCRVRPQGVQRLFIRAEQQCVWTAIWQHADWFHLTVSIEHLAEWLSSSELVFFMKRTTQKKNISTSLNVHFCNKRTPHVDNEWM